jgi:hypothetical protein
VPGGGAVHSINSGQQGIALTGTEVSVLDPPKFSDFIKGEIPRWAQLVKLAGLRPEK